ncbi:hypothetical protein Q5752_006761 [Cryptotrichosporon argae]
MHHYAPHPSSTFEGYYTKFDTPSSGSICLIVCAVPRAKERPHQISITHVAPDGATWQVELWPLRYDVKHDAGALGGGTGDFEIVWETGTFGRRGERVFWTVEAAEYTFEAETLARGTPWRPGEPSSTPAGALANLPLPVQWHVHTVDAPATLRLARPGHPTIEGSARAHAEKNWAVSFPSAYIWVQARDHARRRGVSVAGGALFPGVEAFLVGYHGDDFLSFRPPSSVATALFSLGLTSTIDSVAGVAEIDVRGWLRRIVVRARCDTDTLFPLAAPLSTGHAPNYTAMSFQARIEVDGYARSWPWQAWTRVDGDVFERGSLEFGGDYHKQHQN